MLKNGVPVSSAIAAQSLAVCVLLVAGITGGCAGKDMKRDQPGQMHRKTIEQVQQEHTDAWMAVPGVVGTGIGQCQGEPCILIFMTSNCEKARRRIPFTVDGYPVVIQHTGEIRALDTP